ncbi:MAG: hypothetical protein KBG04_07900 [Bacteroidales bacterium]|jgi:hypothetical protein|nr:hypothetical protein [Bacteroidales bacterium]
MNDIFSFKRYSKLLTKELKERRIIILKMVGIVSIIVLGIWLTSILLKGDTGVSPSFRFSMMIMILVITMIAAPFNLYKSYNHPKKGIDYALLPASVYEKFFSMLTIVVIITPITILAALMLTDFVLSIITPSVFYGFAFSGKMDEMSFSSIYDVLIVQWGFIFGNFLFKKSKITKTISLGIGIYLVLGLIFASTVKSVVFGQVDNSVNFSMEINNLNDFLSNNSYDEENKIKWLLYTTKAIVYYIIPVGCLGGTLLKMKNQQYY